MLHNKGLFHSIRDNSTDPYGDGSCIMVRAQKHIPHAYALRP